MGGRNFQYTSEVPRGTRLERIDLQRQDALNDIKIHKRIIKNELEG